MDGLASNLCVLGVMYFVWVVIYCIKVYLTDIEECEYRKNSRSDRW